MMQFASGRNSITICKRCGLQYPYPDPSIETDTLEWVCEDCLDEPDPYRRRRPRIDAQALPPLTQSPDVDVAYGTLNISSNTTAGLTTPYQYDCGANLTVTLPTVADIQALNLPTLWQIGIDTMGYVILVQCQGSDLIDGGSSVQLSQYGNYGVTLEGDLFRVD